MGHAQIPLPDGLADVLNIVESNATRSRGGVKAAEVYAICKDRKWIKISAINNRLVHLETLGFIKREKQGKEFVWSPAAIRAKKVTVVS